MIKIDFNSIIGRGIKVGLTLAQIVALMDISGILKDINVGMSPHPSDLSFLEDNDFISQNEGVVYLTKTGKSIINLKRDFSTLAAQMRGLFPPGMKDGKWAWRSTPSTVKERLETFGKMYPDITDEEILSATKMYLSAFDDDKSRSLLIYFIFKDIDGLKKSILAEYVHSRRDLPQVRDNSGMSPNYSQI